jgi:hypothetical protein
LQLQRTQELARIPETSADGTNNEHSATPGSGDEGGNIQRPRRYRLDERRNLLLGNNRSDWEAFKEQTELLAMTASADPDTMYHHQAMREPDRDEFKKAMQKENDDAMANGNYTIMRRTKVPKGATILPAVWQMKGKRDILS